ncbi:MAG: galactose mutarotase [Sedimentisphaerales bacterium]|nr:galactose mutarotase [Sedimentisphaerales bacterium]
MKTKYVPILSVAALLFITGCNEPTAFGEKKMNIQKQAFGKTEDGKSVDLYTLTNANGLKADIINYGGIVTSLQVPDRNGKLADIVLGCDSVNDYAKKSPYFGALIGRFGNRIAKGKFTLDGVEYTLATNDGPNHLHGGIKGFDKVVWDAKPMQTKEGPSLKLSYKSRDGEEGYPGNLSCTVIYTLTDKDELKISYEAKTDKSTVVNLTHHSYFNLAGFGSGDILGHQLQIFADNFTPVDKTLIPTGKIKAVKGTPMDFTKPMTIGSRIKQVEGGYDHNYVLNDSGGSLALAASVYEPKTGRVMEIFTTEPGIQFYSGNFLDGSIKGKGAVYNKHAGFCLETQHFPDSPNKSSFPSVVLRPGEKYTQVTVHKFSAR